MKKSKETLCWRCKHAVFSPTKKTGCEWTRFKQPVPGWKATEYHKDCYFVPETTFDVHKCPKFERG